MSGWDLQLHWSGDWRIFNLNVLLRTVTLYNLNPCSGWFQKQKILHLPDIIFAHTSETQPGALCKPAPSLSLCKPAPLFIFIFMQTSSHLRVYTDLVLGGWANVLSLNRYIMLENLFSCKSFGSFGRKMNCTNFNLNSVYLLKLVKLAFKPTDRWLMYTSQRIFRIFSPPPKKITLTQWMI